MAEPVSPVVPGLDLKETLFAANQKPYKPLPVFRNEDGDVLSRWKLSWKERLLVLVRGDVFLWVKTFNRLLQPLKIEIERPKAEPQCTVPPKGWWCSRGAGHEGPCAARKVGE